VLFSVTASPHTDSVKTQQTPKPEAQEPEATPPLLLHSASVKQTPLFPSLAGQSPFWNLTIWKTLKNFSCLEDPGSATLVAASLLDSAEAG
jgi:hypothetical protein